MAVRYGLTLCLKDDPALIESYKAHHRDAWPEVISALRRVGVTEMLIYLIGSRLFMVMEGEDGFDPTSDFARAELDPSYMKWVELMQTMQEPAPEAQPGDWWATMDLVFDLDWPQHKGLR